MVVGDSVEVPAQTTGPIWGAWRGAWEALETYYYLSLEWEGGVDGVAKGVVVVGLSSDDEPWQDRPAGDRLIREGDLVIRRSLVRSPHHTFRSTSWLTSEASTATQGLFSTRSMTDLTR